MENISWKSAFEIASNYNNTNSVSLIVFIDDFCPDCNGFVKDLPQLENEHYKVYIVSDGNDMPFKPVNYPVGYLYVPGQKPITRFYENVPIFAVIEESKKHIQLMIDNNDLKTNT